MHAEKCVVGVQCNHFEYPWEHTTAGDYYILQTGKKQFTFHVWTAFLIDYSEHLFENKNCVMLYPWHQDLYSL